MIQEAITQDLAQRGIKKVAADGDVTVAYLVITGNNAVTASYDDYFGTREDGFDLSAKAHTAYNASKNPGPFQAGTLIIDLIDSKSYKLLWRSYASRPILENPTVAGRDREPAGSRGRCAKGSTHRAMS